MQKKYLSLVTLLLLHSSLGATSLSELVESGLKYNSTIEKNRLQTELMKAKQKESSSKRFGEVAVVGSYTHYNMPRTLAPIVPSALSPGSSVDTTKDLFTTGINYSVPLFTGGALEQQIKIDEIAKRMSRSKNRLSREELIYNIRSLYLSALSLQESVVAQREFVKAMKKLKNKIQSAVTLGKKATIDLLKVNNDLVQAQGSVAKTRSTLAMLKSNLRAITHYGHIGHLESLVVKPKAKDLAIEEAELKKLERFKLQDMEIEKGKRLVHKAEASHKPQVALSAYGGYNYDLDQRDPFENEDLWQIALNFKWNIFDFGTSSAKIEQAKIAELQALVQKKSTDEGFQKLFAKAKNEIERGYADYKTALSQYRLLKKSQKIEEARYDAGVATLNDLLLAKSKTQLARAQMIQSKYAYQNGMFYLDYLLERGEK